MELKPRQIPKRKLPVWKMKNDKIVKNVKKKPTPKPVIKEIVNEDGTVTKQEHIPVPDDDGFESMSHSEAQPSEDEENRNNT